MKSFLGHLALWLVILIAAACLLFPWASDQYAQYRNAPLIEAYERQTKEMGKEETASLLATWQAYNRYLAGEETPDEKPRTVNGLLAVLEIPSIGVRLPVYPAGTKDAMASGVVHASKSDLPTGESGGHTVLAGANGHLAQTGNEWIDPWLEKYRVLDVQLLNRLEKLKTGEMMYLLTPSGIQPYLVEEVGQAQPGQLEVPGETENSAWLTVMTNLGEKRLLAHGRLTSIPENAAAMEEADDVTVPADWLNVVIIGAPVLLAGLLVMLLVELARRPHYRLPADWKIREKAEG